MRPPRRKGKIVTEKREKRKHTAHHLANSALLRYSANMKIMLTNDDGIASPAFPFLLAVLMEAGHDCYVVAPDKNNSAVSAGLTLYSPLRARPYVFSEFPQVTAFAVSGTPVDCMRLGLGNLIPKPDLVLSGINLGPNLGTDTLYSGTCAAAQEAALCGCPAAALSVGAFVPKFLCEVAKAALQAIALLMEKPLPFGAYYNINIPDLPESEWKGTQYTNLAVIRYPTEYVHCADPRRQSYYWAPGNFDIRDGSQDDGDTDVRWLREGWVTITPLLWNKGLLPCE